MTERPAPVLTIPEIREYPRINTELVQLLDAGHDRVRLVGGEGQRLLLHGLRGAWEAVVEIEGQAGPELAADLDAPGLLIVCHGSAADGAARGLRSGRLLILGDAGDAVAMTQAGGTVVVRGSTGHRAGLDMSGGTLILLGDVGRLAGERQAGGRIFGFDDHIGPHAGHGRRGGHLIRLGPDADAVSRLDPGDTTAWQLARDAIRPWLSASGSSSPYPLVM